MKIKCVVIDDEPLACECIVNYIKKVDYLELVGTGSNPVELTEILQSENIDLIFLDIQMPIINGIDYLKATPNKSNVIITTAYPSFALEGFSLDVLDYLLKPITFDRFFKAVNKAKDYHRLLMKSGAVESGIKSDGNDYFFIKCDSKFERIYFDEILYIQALQNYVTIYTSKTRYITHLNLKSVEENLDKNKFGKVHKSYIVSFNKIDAIENNEIIIESKRIPIGRNHREYIIDTVVNKKLWKKI